MCARPSAPRAEEWGFGLLTAPLGAGSDITPWLAGGERCRMERSSRHEELERGMVASRTEDGRDTMRWAADREGRRKKQLGPNNLGAITVLTPSGFPMKRCAWGCLPRELDLTPR